MVRRLLLLCGVLCVLCGCGGGVGFEGEGEVDSVPVVDSVRLTQQQVDSLEFRLRHHYTLGYNFKVWADSLLLFPGEGELGGDTSVVRRGQLLVVAQVRRLVAVDSLGVDTFLVKVASDQRTMGWVEEGALLGAVVPDDPLSEALHALMLSRGAWVALLLLGGLVAVVGWGRGGRGLGQWCALHSVYPTLLLVVLGVMGTLFGYIEEGVPEFWLEFYFHPTLNPLLLPPVMAWLVALGWLALLCGLAMLFEVYDNFRAGQGVLFVLATIGLGTLGFIVLYHATRWGGVGYVLLPVYVAGLVGVYVRRIRPRVICGQCGHRLRGPGACPQCGAFNEG